MPIYLGTAFLWLPYFIFGLLPQPSASWRCGNERPLKVFQLGIKTATIAEWHLKSRSLAYGLAGRSKVPGFAPCASCFWDLFGDTFAPSVKTGKYRTTTEIAMTTAARLDLRLDSRDKDRIAYAADLRGVPLATFVRDAALRDVASLPRCDGCSF